MIDGVNNPKLLLSKYSVLRTHLRQGWSPHDISCAGSVSERRAGRSSEWAGTTGAENRNLVSRDLDLPSWY
jgi:hypothetical protein